MDSITQINSPASSTIQETTREVTAMDITVATDIMGKVVPGDQISQESHGGITAMVVMEVILTTTMAIQPMTSVRRTGGTTWSKISMKAQFPQIITIKAGKISSKASTAEKR